MLWPVMSASVDSNRTLKEFRIKSKIVCTKDSESKQLFRLPRLSVLPPSVCVSKNQLQFLQYYNKMSLIKSCLVCVISEKYTFLVTLRSQSDCYRRGEAEVHIINFKTTWSEFQMPSRTAPTEAKPRCIYSILKPHGQSFITSPELVQSSCVRQHTQDVPAQQVLPSICIFL